MSKCIIEKNGSIEHDVGIVGGGDIPEGDQKYQLMRHGIASLKKGAIVRDVVII